MDADHSAMKIRAIEIWTTIMRNIETSVKKDVKDDPNMIYTGYNSEYTYSLKVDETREHYGHVLLDKESDACVPIKVG